MSLYIGSMKIHVAMQNGAVKVAIPTGDKNASSAACTNTVATIPARL